LRAPLVFMENKELINRPGLYILLRLASYVIIFAVVVFWMHYPKFLQTQFILYSVFTLGFTLLLAFDKKFKLKNVVYTVISFQFIFEIVLESGIIFSTGNINSPFSALFLLTIVSASLVYRLVGTLLVASLVSLAYTFIIWLGLSHTTSPEFSMNALRTIFLSQESVFYSILLHIMIFYLIAFISGYLAQRLRYQGRELAATSQALKKAKLETDEILRHLNSGLLTIDAGGSIIYFNHAAERILGYREEDVRGMPCRDVFSERMPCLVNCLMDGILNGVEHPRLEIEITTGEQTKVPLGLSTSILTDEIHALRGIIAIFSDLTDAKRMEAKVRVADRLAAVGEMSASIAHEIRNPLASISGSVEVLKSELKLSGENQRLMSLIVKESHRLSKILSEFLLYARIDRPVYNKVELCHIIGEVVEILYHHESYNEKIRIQIESSESIVYVIGDEDLLKQLLLNLAVNACESFENSEGNLVFKVGMNKVKKTVELYIVDNGPGIKPEIQKKIYQPFFSTKKQGTGLGLSIVHRICTALKTYIQLDSQQNQGTTFLIELKMFSSETLNHELSVTPGTSLKSSTV